ncbi:MAG: metallophosphatase family protein [Pseudomonadota bacterium]
MFAAHFTDLHYSPDNLQESDRCFGFAVDNAIAQQASIGVISGDSTDHRLDAHAPALNALAKQIHRLADAMPVLMLQGTYSHEPPGTLDNFALMGDQFDVYIAARVQQVAVIDRKFWPSNGPVFTAEELKTLLPMNPEAVFTCLPTLHKGQLAVSVGAQKASTDMAEILTDFMLRAGKVNAQLRAAGIATIGVSHGTVNGCTTEHGVTMAGFDHEFSLAALFEAQCDAFMLGHIHKHQQWVQGGQTIAYGGSIGRFHYGEIGEKGYLLWDVESGNAQCELIPTPSRQMITVDFDGPPDIAELERVAATAAECFVRVRWQVDEEHRQTVDRQAIEALFASAAGLKVEARILPVVTSRAKGISQEVSLDRKLSRWCELSSVDADPLLARLQLLALGDADLITHAVLARLDDATDAPVSGLLEANPPLSLVPELPVPSAPTGSVLDWLDSTGDLFAA